MKQNELNALLHNNLDLIFFQQNFLKNHIIYFDFLLCIHNIFPFLKIFHMNQYDILLYIHDFFSHNLIVFHKFHYNKIHFHFHKNKEQSLIFFHNNKKFYFVLYIEHVVQDDKELDKI